MNIRRRNLPRGWYPVEKRECQREIESFLEGWSPPSGLKGLKGGMVPHAGWYFSGKLAARVFHLLKQSAGKVDLIVLYGGHLGPDDLPRMVMENQWETPFGPMEIDTEVSKELGRRIDLKPESPASGDNTLEIHLPMLRYFFPNSKLLTIRSPSSLQAIALGEEVGRISKQKGLSLLAVGSTDLTHYGPNYGFVSRGTGPSALRWVREENDRKFIDFALKMDAEGLIAHANEQDSACSAGAAASAIATCKYLGSVKGRLIDYYTSYDILPDESFVGYAGIVYEGG
ncbi:MAG: AmmeMemoRadiSam system protein B [Desulfobacterota bacterium]|nr:AmmeMemoRadiSam system protein B [Thermodesulfobacteriota bacterium]